MDIAYVTTYDGNDIQKWSGTGYHISEALKNQLLYVEHISSLNNAYSLPFKAAGRLYNRLFKKNYLADRNPSVLKNYARQVSKSLSHLDADVVFSPGTVPITYLECRQPIAFWTDATFAGMIDFYPEFSNLCEQSIKDGNRMEQMALERCQLAIYSSDWAAKTAINKYRVNPSKVKVVPFGANIKCNRDFNDIKEIVASRPRDKCKLLFLGVDWFRKGGDVALEVAKQLNEAGINVELTIAGCQPVVEEPLPNYVKSLGFISKSTHQGRHQIDKLLAESHFLILPSRAECYGVVFCEANSFGVPCIAANSGGIPTIIKNGLNGQLFSENAEISEYCNYISDTLSNYSQYENLALSSFYEYQDNLNWAVAGKTVKKMLMELN